MSESCTVISTMEMWITRNEKYIEKIFINQFLWVLTRKCFRDPLNRKDYLKMSSEEFSLKWTDFESNISGAFRELREEKDFFDITLVCDNDQIQAHKVLHFTKTYTSPTRTLINHMFTWRFSLPNLAHMFWLNMCEMKTHKMVLHA